MARQEIDVNVNVNSKQAQTNLNTVSKDLDKVAKSTDGVKQGFEDLPGELGEAQKGVSGLTKAFKALLANPILLVITGIIVALKGLFKAFTKTQEGADTFNDIMKGIGGVLDEIVSRLGRLGSAIVKIFKGDFKGAAQEAKLAFTDLSDAIKGAYTAATDIEKQRRALFEAETNLIVLQAQRRDMIEDEISLTRDLTNSVSDRIAALERAGQIERNILTDNLKLQEDRLALAKAELEATPKNQRTREQLRKVEEETAKFIEMQTQSKAKLREIQNRLNTEIAAQKADEKSITEEKAKQLLILKDQFKELVKIAPLAAIDKDKYQERLDAAIRYYEELLELRVKDDESARRSAKTQKEMQYDKWDAALMIADYSVGLLGEIAEGNFALEKAANIAKAIMNTALGASMALTATPFPPVNAALMAITIAMGAVQVAKIASTKIGDTSVQSSSGASASVAGVSTGVEDIINAPPELAQNVNVMNQNNQPPLRAYVVSRDMSSQQDLDKRISDQASL